MKIPDTITAKAREFREKVFEDPEGIETRFEQALLDIRRETAEEISARFKAMQERYPEFCLDVFYDSDMDFMFIKTTEYERIKPS